MNYLTLLGGALLVLFLFAWCLLVIGILGRGWFLFTERNPKEKPPR